MQVYPISKPAKFTVIAHFVHRISCVGVFDFCGNSYTDVGDYLCYIDSYSIIPLLPFYLGSPITTTCQHFVGECAFFETERSVYIEKLSTSAILSDDHISRLKNPDFLTQLRHDVSPFVDIENFDCEDLGSF